MVKFHPITLDDRDTCLELFDEAGWGNTEDDFRRMLHYALGGCFLADDGVGMVSTVNYGSVGWIGNLIVRLKERGKGIGTELMGKAIGHLQECGVQSIRLDAVEKAVDLYRRLGFREEFRSLRYRGTARSVYGDLASEMKETDLKTVFELDETYFGVSRERILNHIYMEYHEHCFTAWEGSRLEGYIMAKLGDPVNRVGPWICNPRRPDLAGSLWNSLMQSFEGNEMWIGIPEDNMAAIHFVKGSGFIEQPSSFRMCLGECTPMGKVTGRFSIGAPDKG